MRRIRNLMFLAMMSAVVLLSGCDTSLTVFEPAGPAARSIMELINWSLVWMLLVVVVVLTLFIVIIWKYRDRKDRAAEEPPEEHGSKLLEVIWTAIPVVIVILLAVPTVQTLYALEEVPEEYADKEPIVIHVTSADWKWIFSYPEYDIETVNYVNIPAGTPVDFRLTSASTMQSFWVPQLGGQKYTMGKMETQLYLVADRPGSYWGKNTNFNGRGYSEMEFEVLALSDEEFDEWVADVHRVAPTLTEEQYEEILLPSHLGRMTFTGTHLQWVDHADMHSPSYTNPELYYNHGYKGKTFEEADNYKNRREDHAHGDHEIGNSQHEETHSANERTQPQLGGEHDGH